MNLHMIFYVVRFGIRIRDRTQCILHIIMEIGKLDHQIKGLENFKFDLYGMSLIALTEALKLCCDCLVD